MSPTKRTTLMLLAMSLPATAFAQSAPSCEQGRERSPETAGRCCWPAQRWSDARARCEGPPACPPDRVAAGDACVPRSDSAPVTEARIENALTADATHDRERDDAGGGRHVGVLSLGLTSSVLGYGFASYAALASLDPCTRASEDPADPHDRACTDMWWALPGVGPLIAAIGYSLLTNARATGVYSPVDPTLLTLQWSFAIVDSSLQLGGAIATWLGARRRPTAHRATAGLRWSPGPPPPGAALGLSIAFATE